MGNSLSHNAYGKSNVRLTKVSRQPDGRHDLIEVSVDIELQGAFEKSYTLGDNSMLVATDTMKNTVYALAQQNTFNCIEVFGQLLAAHFVGNNDHITQAAVRLSETPFQRIAVNGQPHHHSFVGGGSERRTAAVTVTRERTTIQSGLDGLLILKTTDSAFTGFLRDRYTTLRETNDRIFATILQMEWTYRDATACPDYNAAHAKARDAALRVFATNFSDAVQQTLYQMGDEVLKALPEISDVTLTMPNKHRLPANLAPFDLTNDNEIFVTTDEPFGVIRGTVKRDE
ncbi:MAG: urate oxidase [Phycisphaerales bacterium]|jgi:urate oxidase|nr:urate oxidase [Phycisphaerales bacterium]